jgi:hypothetical protein
MIILSYICIVKLKIYIMSRVISRESMINKLERAYPEMKCMLTEDFNGSEGGIWLSAEDGITDRNGSLLFDYWAGDEGGKRQLGVIAHLERFANRNGWFFEWNDAGTIMLWLI